MRRRIAVAVALAAVLAGAAVATTVATGGSGGAGVKGVVSRVRTSFGDGRLLSSSVAGPVLSVRLAFDGSASRVKAIFEAQVLAQAVADWQRSSGHQPITAVRYLDARGKVLEATSGNGDSVRRDPHASPLAPGACQAAAAAVKHAFTHVSARTLPLLNVCLFSSSGPGDPISALDGINRALGPHDHAVFFELDDASGNPQQIRAWVPGGGGQAWAAPGLPPPFGV